MGPPAVQLKLAVHRFWVGSMHTSKHGETTGEGTGVVRDGDATERDAGLQVLRVLQVHAAAREAAGVVPRRHVARRNESVDT